MTSISISVKPDFNDYPDIYVSSMNIKHNVIIYDIVRKHALDHIIYLCREHKYDDYIIVNIKAVPSDFLILTTDSIHKCILSECSCITNGINFLFKLKHYIINKLEPAFEDGENEIHSKYALSTSAIKRLHEKNLQSKNIRELRAKNARFIKEAEELNEMADIEYFTIELLKRIYLREMAKILTGIQCDSS